MFNFLLLLPGLLPPKFQVMIIADLGLSSSRSKVRLSAVELTAELCNRLPVETLNANLTALVLGLFNIFESPSNEYGKKEGRGLGDVEVGVWGRGRGRVRKV